MVPTPMSGVYHMHSNSYYIIIILQFTEYDSKKKTLPDNRSQCGTYPGKWQYGQLLLMNKVALPVSHTDTHAAWLMQTRWTRGGQMVKRRQHCFLRESKLAQLRGDRSWDS